MQRTNDVLTDWRTFPPMLLGALGALTGLVLLVITRDAGWLLLLFGGAAVEFTAPALHDRRHLRHGEQPHAMWGAGDWYRPAVLGGPRRR